MEQRLLGLDALRGIAALVVALGVHQTYLLGWPINDVFAWLFEYGVTMVDLFFVISGFIFSHVYMTSGRIEATARQFALARFARLYPLHLATLLAAAGIAVAGVSAGAPRLHNDAWHLLLGLLFLQETGLNAGLSFNFPSWSVSVEILCYAIFFIVGRRYHRIAFPLALALALVGAWSSTHHELGAIHISRGLCGFFMGTLAWRLRGAPVSFCLGLAAFGVAGLALGAVLHPGAILSLTCWPALVILAPRIRALTARPLVWLGDRSYSIYLLHMPIYMSINVLLFAGEPIVRELGVPLAAAGGLAVLLAADIVYRRFEVPARRWLRGFGAAQAEASPIAR